MGSGAGAEAVKGAFELAKAGAKNPSLRSAGQNLAFGFDVVTGLVKTALLPLAVVNARAKDYFERKFPEELAGRLQDVPPEWIVSPKPSVAGPALQGLGYSHEEVPLRELYIGLLAKSMDGRQPDKAHPGFAEIIAALSADEVSSLQAAIQLKVMGLAQLRSRPKIGEGWTVSYRHLTSMARGAVPYENPMLAAYIDNWVRLGLVEVSYADYLIDAGSYDWVTERPEYVALLPTIPEDRELVFEKGVLQVTAFGEAFAEAVGIAAHP